MVQARYGRDEAQHEPQDLLPLGFDPNHAIEVVTKATKENPHAALAGAFAVGFVLGGGVTPKLLGAVAMFAARRYLRATIEESLANVQATLEKQGTPEL
ncbi:MAG: hypothetical protein IPM54_09895 [Polyangiaceae bacterium]|nr:hypothetical protein [Polyangiaceae bacterium]